MRKEVMRVKGEQYRLAEARCPAHVQSRTHFLIPHYQKEEYHG